MAGKKRSYILLNKASDYERGIRLGTVQPEAACGIRLQEGFRSGLFVSKLYDAGQTGMEWHRICLNPEMQSNSSIGISVYTCDTETDARQVRLQLQTLKRYAASVEATRTERDTDSLRDPGEAAEVAKALNRWAPYLKKSTSGYSDILLNQVEGRYLWLVISFRRYYEMIPEIHEIRVEFPKRSYLDLLPEIYRQDPEAADFLHRFLALFQRMDEELEDTIDDIPSLMDPCNAPREYLEWLAGLIGMESTGLWNDEQLRYLIRNAAKLYRIRGTKAYLTGLLELYSNRKPIVIEYRQSLNMQDITCSDPFEFVILLPEPQKMNADIYQNLQRIIELSKPAWMSYKLIILRPYCFMDQYSYTGINTVLGQYRPAILNDESMIPYATCEGVGMETGEDAK